MKNKDNMQELFNLFSSYNEDDWYNLITNIFNFTPLNLPVDIESDHPQETLIYIDFLLRNFDKNIADIYVKNLIDYYSTLNNIQPNIKYFKAFHSIFAHIKPTKYRYVLEYKLTKEDFLNNFSTDVGEDLQIDLISTLSNLRYVKDETTTSYLFNNISKYSSKYYILISLRYFQRSGDVPTYYEYLNQLIEESININNTIFFIEAFKELIFQKKSFKVLYDWFTKFKNIKETHFEILISEMRKWLNYSNQYMIDKNYPYAKLLFYEINKEHIIPCYTIKTILSYNRRFPHIISDLKKYIRETSINNKNLVYSGTYKNVLYRFPRDYTNKLLLDITNVPDYYLKNLSEMYHIDRNKILSVELSTDEAELIYSIITKLEVKYIKKAS